MAIALGSVAALLAGCGDATSVDYAERDAEDVRREEARSAEVADAVAERAAADKTYEHDRAAGPVADDGHADIEQPGT